MNTIGRPERSEAVEYYFRYIDLVPEGDIRVTLEAQLPETIELLARVSTDRVDYRYEPGKWTVREVLGHLNDTERLFTFRAFWFARGFDSELPSFEQEIAVKNAGAADRPWTDLVDEFRSVRLSTLSFFRRLPPEAWLRRGVASGNPFSVRSLAYLAAGHVMHHTAILRGRYLGMKEQALEI
ncbi:MAG: DinB family protein [Acidobacteriota bacterium]